MCKALLVAVLLFPSLCCAQALPGGQYVMPSSPAMDSYAPQHKEKFAVHVLCLMPVKDRNGSTSEKLTLIGKYSIVDSQWPGLKKNIAKFCKQQNLQVSEVHTEALPITIHLEQIPPKPKKESPPVVYPKGTGPAPYKTR